MSDSIEYQDFPPPNYTMQQRRAVFEDAESLYTKIFKHEGKARTERLKEQPDDNETEHILFDTISLEINDEPSFYIVDYYLRPITGPRLELHLHDATGMHNARVQLGRIARYIDARQLAEDYPYISATTFTPLARLANLATFMPPAITIYVPDREEGDDDVDNRLGGAFESFNQFLEKHHRPQLTPEEAQFTSLVVATNAFVRRWRDHQDSSLK